MTDSAVASSGSADRGPGGNDPAEELWRLWRQGQAPDVDAFVARLGPLPAAQVAALLRIDQRERWRAGERVLAESYLQRYPQVGANQETAVDLIFNEFLERERLGELPAPEEYLRRFPQYAGELQAQIQLHQELKITSGAVPSSLGDHTITAGDSARPPAMGTALALVLGGGMQSDLELQALLRRRLWFVSLVGFVFYGFRMPVLVSFYAGTALGIFILTIAGSLLALLWSRLPLSLRQLRWIELTLFGSNCLCLLGLNYAFLHDGWLAQFADLDWYGMAVAGRSLSWVWGISLIAYGILIPNTWQRCAVVLGVMALCPVALNLIWCLREPAVEPRLLSVFLSGIVLDLALGSALAVFGAHRLETLRSAANEARKLGQYQLQRRLGTGGMGEVYLAEHVGLRRLCALKLIRPERAGESRHLRRFEREVQATAQLTHPHIVQVFDFGHAADGTFYYAMEYLPGLNLDELVASSGPLPAGRAIHLLRQVCGALEAAHAAGLIHRDIKPGNIIVGPGDGQAEVAKLLDFGLVQVQRRDAGATQLTQEGDIAGTPAFMAPEQAAGLTELDGRSDIYSLGALAYFLLTGQPPFPGQAAVGVLAAHLHESPAPLTDHCPAVPDDLQAVVLRCLAKKPGQRFPDVSSLAQALAHCAAAGCWTEAAAATWWRAQSGLLRSY
jgi:serine/threonine-protein kinase